MSILVVVFAVVAFLVVKYEKARWRDIIIGALGGLFLGASIWGGEISRGVVWIIQQIGLAAQQVQ